MIKIKNQEMSIKLINFNYFKVKTSGQCKGTKGLGKGSENRHRKVLYITSND
jgi:hypothetical protein